MGTLCSRQSSNPPKSSVIDPASYLLGNQNTGENHFDTNHLSFIPDSEQQWETLPSLNRPKSPVKFSTPIVYSNEMPTYQKYKCDQCGMIFPSNESLFKHKTRFCIGVKDSGIGRQPVYSDDEDTEIHTKRSNNRKVIRHQSPVQKKREEVNDWKRQRSILQTVEDMEDRIMTDSVRTQVLTDGIKKQDRTYNEILLEYERLQKQERDVLQQMYSIQVEPTVTYPSTKVKPTINLTDQQKDQFKDLHRKNLRLERERQVIQQKLEELISTNYQPSTMTNYEPYRFLREMKEQHELNEKALNFLRTRLIYQDNTIPTLSDVPTLPYVNNRYTRLRRTGGDSVRSFRNSYLNSGGHDANVITRYSDIEHRLRAYEDYPWTKDYPEPLKPNRFQWERSTIDPQTEQLKLANEQNQRLQHELDDMHKKFSTLSTRTRQMQLSMATNGTSNSINHQPYIPPKHDLPPPPPPPLPPPPPSQPQPTPRDNDQFDQRQNYLHTSLPVYDRRITSRASPAMSLLASNMHKLRDPLAPHSYDPIGGFVIFFDFVSSLPINIDQCSLVTCLYHPKSGLGEPSELEPFKCEPYADERTGERTSIALIATKQPVPRCPPQQALTVVIEVQTATAKQSADNELRTNAWTKLPLFDTKNRLLSGRWKVPLKALPIHHGESLAIISTLPTYEHAELYYRLVNAQDADDQSHAPLSPSFRELYNFPLQYRN